LSKLTRHVGVEVMLAPYLHHYSGRKHLYRDIFTVALAPGKVTKEILLATFMYYIPSTHYG